MGGLWTGWTEWSALRWCSGWVWMETDLVLPAGLCHAFAEAFLEAFEKRLGPSASERGGTFEQGLGLGEVAQFVVAVSECVADISGGVASEVGFQ